MNHIDHSALQEKDKTKDVGNKSNKVSSDDQSTSLFKSDTPSIQPMNLKSNKTSPL